MEKEKRKNDIGRMALVAAMVKQCMNKPGVCGIHPWLDRRKVGLQYTAGVQLQAKDFMEYFGEDTEYEYITDRDGDMQVITKVNGVVFYALVDDTDLLENGVLV